ncbi:Ribose-5-phosphate isomerase [Nesidiocoris tenuis]|nr:Ribose-5-phosphate isomerase [Nesidiocoris tenuis]
MSSSNLVEKGKETAAFAAVDKHVEDGMILGIGSGSTIVYAVTRLAERVRKEGLKIVCIPTSFQAQQLIVTNNLTLGSLDTTPELDCAIDGADEVDDKLTLIKGGGGCQTQEKIVASCARKLVIVADSTKNSTSLGQQYKKIPVEVIPLAYNPILQRITQQFGGTAELRMGKMKAGPIVSDNGNFIVDWFFPTGIEDWKTVNERIKMMPGVVETGLFVDMAQIAYFGGPDGSLSVKLAS